MRRCSRTRRICLGWSVSLSLLRDLLKQEMQPWRLTHGDMSQLLLDHTLKQVGTRYPLVVLTTSSFPEKHLALLTALGIEYRKVDLLEPKGEVKLIAERFRDTWSKLQAFALDDYEVSSSLDSRSRR